jgi:DNA-binding transcriptional LysR family regulator
MNIHFLELFYYVARSGGISEAVRKMPYGIQQPAISSQVGQLEDFLGTTLFQRRPFQLTPTGEELYAFIRPFFDNLGPVAEKIRGGASQHLRLAASEIVLKEHLPGLLQQMRERFPKLKVTLREGYFPLVLDWFARQELDISVGLFLGRLPAGLQHLPMLRLPLVLLLPAASKLRSAEDLWQRDRIQETLITAPSNEAIQRAFNEGLAKRKVDWFSGIEVSTLELVQTYVASGYGVGVSVGVPKAKYRPGVRVLPLTDFPMPTFGAIWAGKPSPVVAAFLELLKHATRELMRGEQPELMLLPQESQPGGETKGLARH